MLPVANSVLYYDMHCTLDFRASGTRVILCYNVHNKQCTSGHTIQGSTHNIFHLLYPHLNYLHTNGEYCMHQKSLPQLSIWITYTNTSYAINRNAHLSTKYKDSKVNGVVYLPHVPPVHPDIPCFYWIELLLFFVCRIAGLQRSVTLKESYRLTQTVSLMALNI